MKNIKLRYYLRGLGIGVLVTAFILGVTNKDGTTMTDAQIRERAYELGMVDSGSLVLSELRNEQAVSESEQVAGVDGENEQETETVPEESTEDWQQQTTDVLTEESQVEEMSDVQESAEAEQSLSTEEMQDIEEMQDTEETANAEEVQSKPASEAYVKDGIAYFEIVYGEGSHSVSRVMAELGLVADAKAFDNYLCYNGYSKVIHTGSYAIVLGTSEEELAKIITGNR